MKWSRHGTAVSQDNYTLQNRMKVLITQEGLIYAEEDTRKNELTHDEVDTRRNGMKDYINEKDTEMVTLKEDEQSHFRKSVENINWLAMNLCLHAESVLACHGDEWGKWEDLYHLMEKWEVLKASKVRSSSRGSSCNKHHGG